MYEPFPIPADSYELIVSRRTPMQSYAELIENGRAPINDILTFGLINTPIIVTATGERCGYVVLWGNRNVTTVDTHGKLMGMEIGRGYVSKEEAVEIFDKYWAAKGGG